MNYYYSKSNFSIFRSFSKPRFEKLNILMFTTCHIDISFLNMDICRTAGCGKPVRMVGNKKNYYCNIHLNCGLLCTIDTQCDGCKNTFQGDERKNNYRTVISEEIDDGNDYFGNNNQTPEN